MTKDYYVVLGVTRGADLNKIKKAYRNVVKKHHPDMVSEREATNKFLEAKDAYETLSNEKSRRLYDQQLERRQSGPKLSRSPKLNKQQSPAYNEVDSFTSVVDEFFGGFLPGFFPDFFEKERSKGKELFLEVILTPHEASEGGLFPIAVPVIAPCPQCSRSGFREDFFCPVCGGNGRVRSEQEFSLSIPPHVKHGTQIRLSLEDIGLRNVSINITVIIDSFSEKLW
jgi:molecular chaperone DnaJ